jgi:hypothetical protein
LTIKIQGVALYLEIVTYNLLQLNERKGGKIMRQKRQYQKLPLEARIDSDGFAVSSRTIITSQRLTCVSVKIDSEQVQVRDTKDPSKTTLSFSHDEWASFIAGVKEDEFTL